MHKLLVGLLSLILCPLALAQQSMNNEAVLKMVKAGLSDDIVISTINATPGTYVTSPDALVALKQAGVSDRVIAALMNKPSNGQAPQAPNTQSPNFPGTSGGIARVYLQSESKGTNRNAARDQSMEMSKDFEKDCTGVHVTINQQMADYTVLLNHIEMGFVRDNQFQIANKDGDLIARTKEGGSINGGVKKACAIILSDWAKAGH